MELSNSTKRVIIDFFKKLYMARMNIKDEENWNEEDRNGFLDFCLQMIAEGKELHKYFSYYLCIVSNVAEELRSGSSSQPQIASKATCDIPYEEGMKDIAEEYLKEAGNYRDDLDIIIKEVFWRMKKNIDNAYSNYLLIISEVVEELRLDSLKVQLLGKSSKDQYNRRKEAAQKHLIEKYEDRHFKDYEQEIIIQIAVKHKIKAQTETKFEDIVDQMAKELSNDSIKLFKTTIKDLGKKVKKYLTNAYRGVCFKKYEIDIIIHEAFERMMESQLLIRFPTPQNIVDYFFGAIKKDKWNNNLKYKFVDEAEGIGEEHEGNLLSKIDREIMEDYVKQHPLSGTLFGLSTKDQEILILSGIRQGVNIILGKKNACTWEDVAQICGRSENALSTAYSRLSKLPEFEKIKKMQKNDPHYYLSRYDEYCQKKYKIKLIDILEELMDKISKK